MDEQIHLQPTNAWKTSAEGKIYKLHTLLLPICVGMRCVNKSL